MTEYEAMHLYLLACLVAKGTGDYVENFLSDAREYAKGVIDQPKATKPSQAKEMAEDAEILAAVDRLYKLYPSKCPNRGTGTGKCAKDKARLYKLLTKEGWTEEKLTFAIQSYVDEVTEKRGYLKNFSTFLNNIPEVEEPIELTLDQETDNW